MTINIEYMTNGDVGIKTDKMERKNVMWKEINLVAVVFRLLARRDT